MEEGLLVRGKRDTKPFLLKLGFALALSLAGYFASHLRSRPRLPPPRPSSDDGLEEASGVAACSGRGGLKDELRILTSEEALANIINGTSTITTTVATDEEGFLLPEFNQVIMEEYDAYPETIPTSPMSKKLEIKEEKAMEEEIAYLRNLVQALRERERSLEIQMLEYCGLKEQEAALRELENRLKVNAMETKLLSLKVESLQADNQRLQAQVSDYPRITAELDSAREKIKILKGKLNFEREQTKEKLACLNQKIDELRDKILRGGEDDAEVKKKLKMLKDLEDEVMDLRKVNSRLAEENSKLVQQLESKEMAASSNLKGPEVESLEEASHLREENEELKKEIEQLQTDRCADVEELVYLRWVNACLRYELRNYQPPPGKAVARDLSKSLSPKSEERAKQLILEYAHSGVNEKSMSLLDFDSQSCSSSQTSSEECSDTSIDISSSTKNSISSKSKFFSKLKKLVLGKDNQRSKINSVDRTTSCGNSMRRASISPCSFEETGRRNSFDSISSFISVENASVNQSAGMESHANEQWQNKIAQSQRSSRSSLDVQRLRRLDIEVKESIGERCKSDVGTSYGHMRMISEDDCLSGLNHNLDHEDVDVPEKVKLKKFADVLKGSHGSLKLKRRLASFSSN